MVAKSSGILCANLQGSAVGTGVGIGVGGQHRAGKRSRLLPKTMRIFPCALLLPLLGLLPSLGAGAERTFTVFVAAAERLLQLLNSPEADRAFARTGFLVVPRSP